MAAASTIFSDCSPSSMTARLLPLRRIHIDSILFRSSISPPPPPRRRTISSAFAARMTAETSAKVIDGKSIAKQIRDEITIEISRMKDATGVVPGLAVILVGSRKDSQTYVRNKKKACFNNDPSIHGILVQLPLPRHMDEENILNSVSIEKDVDGFHPLNIGRLAMRGREPLFVPCTPKGCIELLHRSGVEIKGKRAVVIGRSNIVGMPAALLLQRENATVAIVHSYTKNPEEITRQADIVISAAGVANMVRGSWIKPGAVVIDVGINAVDDPESHRGYRLVGDVCYKEACTVASAITPVPVKTRNQRINWGKSEPSKGFEAAYIL
ncbi:hypothetical protein MRB53_006661 [Persea americana]|uniref:Uncharacterized protein n=1 Tax=Persea americana TaxID=3435 RepID=A0ACC2MH98_PERAE|nr:hypothetical protein MRB53_006661 [Persea americana]